MTKYSVCCSPHLRNHTSCHLSYTIVEWLYLQVVFFFFLLHFFKILIFWVVSGVKGQKMDQIDNKFCLWHSISQKPGIIWLPFMVHMCKMMVSPGFFTFLGGKMAKNGLKWEKNVCHAPYLRNHTSCNRHLLYTSVKWWYLQVFFFFFTFYFSGC